MSPPGEKNKSGMYWLDLVKREKIIAVIRSSEMATARKMAQTVAAGGIKLIEITANTDRAWELIESLKSELPHCSIGTGTVLNRADLDNAIACGAEYVFMPHVDVDLIKHAIAAHRAIVPGALSPTEIVTAWNAGATAVKIFPIQAVGGVSYLQALRGPIGHIPSIPTGGVRMSDAVDFLEAGAVAVGLASCLFPREKMEIDDWDGIRDRVINLLNRVQNGRGAQ
jgi:2-dehydro-3-deoxyphosphogluconate aldolase / (4S)-4-hydroxy-2-oxoglutarate aldolase